MAWISDPEDEGPHPQPSSSKSKIVNGLSCLPSVREGDSLSVRLTDNTNPLADFEFDKLPTELLVEIFRHARTESVFEAYTEIYPYPVALSQVCRHWRTVAIGAPTLWTSVRVSEYHTEDNKEAARTYLERSKKCPIFLTWFAAPGQFYTNVPAVVDTLIIPAAERWQRITIFTSNKAVTDAVLGAMEPLDFPILQDIEISWVPFLEPISPKTTLCLSAPLLRRCRFRDLSSLPPLPSNLVVLDCVFAAFGSPDFDLDPLLEFLPHVAHTLEHLRFGPPPTSQVHFTPHTTRIPLENLKSLLFVESHAIVDHIIAPNLTHFVASYPAVTDATMGVAGMFDGFSAPNLRSIQFHRTPLSPLLAVHNLPSMFPKLESVLLSNCTHESAFISLLEPPKPKKPSSLKKASKYPQKHRKVENPLPNLKELTVSDMTNWTSLQAAIEKRLKNTDKTLRKIQLPKGGATESIMPHLRRWLPAQGIELVLYEDGELPKSAPEFQDEFCNEENELFEMSMEADEWDHDDCDDDEDDYYWDERAMDHPDYELPSYLDPNQYWNEFGEDYDDEEEGYEDDEDDFYEG